MYRLYIGNVPDNIYIYNIHILYSDFTAAGQPPISVEAMLFEECMWCGSSLHKAINGIFSRKVVSWTWWVVPVCSTDEGDRWPKQGDSAVDSRGSLPVCNPADCTLTAWLSLAQLDSAWLSLAVLRLASIYCVPLALASGKMWQTTVTWKMQWKWQISHSGNKWFKCR